MNRREFASLVAEAEKREIDNFSALSNVTADIIRTYDHPIISKDGALALIRWQALCFNGLWDQEALNEVFHFMKSSIVLGGKKHD